METNHVHYVYEQIAHKFNHTRFSHWNIVKQFLDELPKYSLVADIGTGNGKYLSYRKDITMIGNDRCNNLLNIIGDKYINCNICCADALYLPYRNNTFDAIISIAVFHHISNDNNRRKFIEETIRIMKPNGLGLITVWAREQYIKSTWKNLGDNDYFVPWVDTENNKKYDRYYHLFTQKEIVSIFEEFNYTLSIIKVVFEMNNWCIVFKRC
jgi:ubiquinone/menaquinone biosynthesis C-methylase UbiE